LAETYYSVPGLSNMLLEHLAINAAAVAAPASAPTLGRDFNFQFSYEHSAAAAARNNPAYRYVAVPDRIDLSNAANNSYYAQASVTLPGIGPPGAKAWATIPAVRVAWGLTILKNSPNQEHTSAFVNMLLGAVGTAAFNANGPTAIAPAFVSSGDYARLPKWLRPLVTTEEVLP
jgi:ABC-type molybdate transport system substrate-binding protein